jgi:hypothetical protein
MDIGFVAMTPFILEISGITTPLTMLGLCALGFAMGWVMRLNIKRYEPVADKKDLLHSIAQVAMFSLIIASVVNVGYYLQLMAGIIIFPFDIANPGTITTIIALGTLAGIALIGFFFGLEKLNQLGNRTTAFNLAAVAAIIVGFIVYNVFVALDGAWALPNYNPPVDSTGARQILGFFALVQGFEASRYLGEEFSAERRIATMRRAQIIATVAFVLFPLSALLLFAEARPGFESDAVVTIAQLASPVLPYIIILLGIGSQASASINAISSRSDVLEELSGNRIPRRITYPLLAAGAGAVVLFTDVNTAVAAASRVFAAFFTIQCVIALILAVRVKKWGQAVGITLVGLAMLSITIFGLST